MSELQALLFACTLTGLITAFGIYKVLTFLFSLFIKIIK